MTELPLAARAENAASPADQLTAADERELARGLAARDPGALAELYDRYAPALHRLLCAMLGSTADAEDALQEVFARLAAGRARELSDLKSYVFTAARNEALSVLRKRRREALFSLRFRAPEPAVPGNGDAHADLPALLQRLPPEQREVVALKVFEQMTFAEIGALVRASPNTVAARYRYALIKLRQWYGEDDPHAV